MDRRRSVQRAVSELVCDYDLRVLQLTVHRRDAIFRSFGVDSKNTDLEAKEDKRKRRFVITARRQRSSPALSSGSGTESELLGFIRYTYDKEELGTLEIANFKARLQLRHLRMGGSTKQKDETQAGQHGEGMKLAAMVLRRSPQRYSVRCLSSGCYWNFQLDNRKSLFCKLTRPKDETLRQKKAKYRQRERDRLPRLLEANIWEDVCVEVGYVRASKGDTGEERKTQKIPLLEFQRWLEVTIDINPPTEIVRTESGDLILDEKHKNKAYLRGLLLPQSSITGKTCHYGYNFLRGQTDRDRSNIVNAWEEASRITNIWRDALLSGPEIVAKYDLVRKYTRLLLDQNQLAADVNLADQYISRKVAGLIWRHLTVEVPQKDGSKLFYYCDKDGPEVSFKSAWCIESTQRLTHMRSVPRSSPLLSDASPPCSPGMCGRCSGDMIYAAHQWRSKYTNSTRLVEALFRKHPSQVMSSGPWMRPSASQR